jgi:hypothetical protein
MSNRFKFEPYSYSKNAYTDESEERILCNRKSDTQKEEDRARNITDPYYKSHFDTIKGIKKYIIGIEIDKYYDLEIRNDGYYKKMIEKIQKLIPNVKIKFTEFK